MSSGTRAARASSSRQVKQQLVRLLFGKKYSLKGPEAHRRLDASIYSFGELKKAYLNRLQEIHPDKNKLINDTVQAEDLKRQFQELQDAWSKYDELARSMKTLGDGTEEKANFTMFGVGCSFSDNDHERDLRAEITDQACRGWFSSGLLPEVARPNDGKELEGKFKAQPLPLLDDSLFEEISEVEQADKRDSSKSLEKPKPRHLIPGLK